RVDKRLVEPGEVVAAGSALLVLDGREARANLAAAQASLQEAEALLAEATRQEGRVRTLGDGAAEAQRDQAGLARERAEPAVAASAAQRELARLNLDHMALRAPFAGAGALLEPAVGESAAPGAGPIARVVDVSSGRVVVGLLEDEVGAAR